MDSNTPRGNNPNILIIEKHKQRHYSKRFYYIKIRSATKKIRKINRSVSQFLTQFIAD